MYTLAEESTLCEKKQPRLWPVVIASLLAFICIILAPLLSMVALLLWGLLSGDISVYSDSFEYSAWIEVSGLMPAQHLLNGALRSVMILIIPVGFACFSTESIQQRLGVGKINCSLPVLILLAIGSIFFATVTDAMYYLLFSVPAELVESVSIGIASNHGMVTVLYFITSVIVGPLAAELLFRGYIQRRLLQRFQPWLAIGMSSLLYAGIHLDIVHAVVVFPTAVWLGIIAWRTGSIWPAVAGHIGINIVWFLGTWITINRDSSERHVEKP